MPQSLTEQAHKATIDSVKKDRPQSFTVGGAYKDGKLVAGVTYDRKWSNGWGATAYARAWWDDLPIVANPVPKAQVEAGFEIRKQF